jgi:hypothetical protein
MGTTKGQADSGDDTRIDRFLAHGRYAVQIAHIFSLKLSRYAR